MRIRLLGLCILLITCPLSSNAQFIGIKIGIPSTFLNGVGGGIIPGGGIQDDAGHFLQDDSSHFLTVG